MASYRGAYADKAPRGHLWVARYGDDPDVAGYVLFGGRRPQLRVFQLFVSERHRGKGIGSRLLAALREHAPTQGYHALRTKVAAELEANQFWARSGFTLVRQEHRKPAEQ